MHRSSTVVSNTVVFGTKDWKLTWHSTKNLGPGPHQHSKDWPELWFFHSDGGDGCLMMNECLTKLRIPM